LISFLYDGAKFAFDGSIDIADFLDGAQGRLLQQNVVLGKDISVKVLPQLNVASHNVRAAHGAKIDSLDTQKLFYMMSRGLTKQQSQKLLVDGYIEHAFSQFSELTQKDKKNIYSFFFQ
jgi:Fe-S cluster assembly scaffold protein SufB